MVRVLGRITIVNGLIYGPLGDLTNQNFTAVLIGDVSGNWTRPAPTPPPLAASWPRALRRKPTRTAKRTERVGSRK